MYCQRLTLKDFRNYRRLDLSLSTGLTIFQGENASGKTTLLEALYLLATTKSPRAANLTDAIESANSIETPDKSTVKITLKAPFAPFLERLTAGAPRAIDFAT